MKDVFPFIEGTQSLKETESWEWEAMTGHCSDKCWERL